SAGVLEDRAVDREEDHERRGDEQRLSDHALDAEVLIADDVVEILGWATERTGHEVREVRVRDRDEAEGGEMPADGAPRRLEHEEDRRHAEGEIERRRAVRAIDDVLEIHEHVRRDRDRRERERDVRDGDALQPATVRGIEKDHEDGSRAEEQHHVDLLGGDRLAEDVERRHEHEVGEGDLRARGGVVQREERDRHREARDEAIPEARERPRLGLALELLDELAVLFVRQHLLEIGPGDDLLAHRSVTTARLSTLTVTSSPGKSACRSQLQPSPSIRCAYGGLTRIARRGVAYPGDSSTNVSPSLR